MFSGFDGQSQLDPDHDGKAIKGVLRGHAACPYVAATTFGVPSVIRLENAPLVTTRYDLLRCHPSPSRCAPDAMASA